MACKSYSSCGAGVGSATGLNGWVYKKIMISDYVLRICAIELCIAHLGEVLEYLKKSGQAEDVKGSRRLIQIFQGACHPVPRQFRSGSCRKIQLDVKNSGKAPTKCIMHLS